MEVDWTADETWFEQYIASQLRHVQVGDEFYVGGTDSEGILTVYQIDREPGYTCYRARAEPHHPDLRVYLVRDRFVYIRTTEGPIVMGWPDDVELVENFDEVFEIRFQDRAD